jgi:hypothetical protein
LFSYLFAFLIQFVGWLTSSPHILVILLLTSVGTVASWRFLTKTRPPPILKSARTSLLLLVVIVLGIVWDRRVEVEVGELKEKLVVAEWKINQG